MAYNQSYNNNNNLDNYKNNTKFQNLIEEQQNKRKTLNKNNNYNSILNYNTLSNPKLLKKKLINKLDGLISTNMKIFSMTIVEVTNNVIFHFLDTIKVRLQARSLVNDVSGFYKNKVVTRPVFNGVISAGIGSSLSTAAFVLSNDYFLSKLFSKQDTDIDNLDSNINKARYQRYKSRNNTENINSKEWKDNLLKSYLLSDIIKQLVFIPFEYRKQKIQMYHITEKNNLSLLVLSRALPTYILRDVITRIFTLGSTLYCLDVRHDPILKYNHNDITDYIKEIEINNEKIDTFKYIDYSNFIILSPYNQSYLFLIGSIFFSTLITNPLDVVATKQLCQIQKDFDNKNKDYYRNFIQSFMRINKEEGFNKLLWSGFNFRLMFNLLSAINIVFTYQYVMLSIKKYYNGESFSSNNSRYNNVNNNVNRNNRYI